MTHHGRELSGLNELEFIDGLVWANIYKHTILVAVDPATGTIIHSVDCISLHAEENAYRSENGIEELWKYNNELNGIAWDPATEEMYLTGKLWHLLFKVKLI